MWDSCSKLKSQLCSSQSHQQIHDGSDHVRVSYTCRKMDDIWIAASQVKHAFIPKYTQAITPTLLQMAESNVQVDHKQTMPHKAPPTTHQQAANTRGHAGCIQQDIVTYGRCRFCH